MKERRIYKRYTIAYPLEGDPVGPGLKENLLDVSKSGIAFVGKKDVLEEETIVIRLFLKTRMFSLKALVVYVKTLESGENIIGAKFIDPPREFEDVFEREINEIKYMYREQTLHKNKNASFKSVARQYLEVLDHA